MFNQHQLIQIEFALKFVIGELENVLSTTEDARWLGDLCELLSVVQIEQRHASEACEAD